MWPNSIKSKPHEIITSRPNPINQKLILYIRLIALEDVGKLAIMILLFSNTVNQVMGTIIMHGNSIDMDK